MDAFHFNFNFYTFSIDRLIHGHEITQLNPGELVDTYIAVDKYLVESLKNDLCTYLKTNLDGSTAVMIFDQMIESNRIGLPIEDVASCVQSNCEDIFNNELHIELSEKVLMAILNIKSLYISEIDVLKAISKWIEAKLKKEGLAANRTNLQEAFVPFKPLVRFTDLTVNDFIEHKNLIDDLLSENEAYSLLGHLNNETVQLNISYEGDRIIGGYWVYCDATPITRPPDANRPLAVHLKVNRKVSIWSIRTILRAVSEQDFKCKAFKWISGKCAEIRDLKIKQSVVCDKLEIRFPNLLEMSPDIWYSFDFEFTDTLSIDQVLFHLNIENGQGLCSLRNDNKNSQSVQFRLATTKNQAFHCIERVNFRYTN